MPSSQFHSPNSCSKFATHSFIVSPSIFALMPLVTPLKMPSKFLARCAMLSPELSQPDSKIPTTQHTKERDEVREMDPYFYCCHSSIYKTTKTPLQCLYTCKPWDLRRIFLTNLSQRLSLPSLNPSDRIYKHPSDYIIHSHHGSVWGNRPQLPTTWVSLGETAHNCPLALTHLSHSHPSMWWTATTHNHV